MPRSTQSDSKNPLQLVQASPELSSVQFHPRNEQFIRLIAGLLEDSKGALPTLTLLAKFVESGVRPLEAAPVLTALLHHQEPSVRTAAIKELSQLPSEVVDVSIVVFCALARERTSSLREEIRKSLPEQLAHQIHHLEYFQDRLRFADAAKKADLSFMLSIGTSAREALPHLTLMHLDSSPQVCSSAAYSFARLVPMMNDKFKNTFMLSIVYGLTDTEHDDVFTKYNLLYGAEKLGRAAAPAVPAIESLCDHKAPSLRSAAAVAALNIGAINRERISTALVKVLSREDEVLELGSSVKPDAPHYSIDVDFSALYEFVGRLPIDALQKELAILRLSEEEEKYQLARISVLQTYEEQLLRIEELRNRSLLRIREEERVPIMMRSTRAIDYLTQSERAQVLPALFSVVKNRAEIMQVRLTGLSGMALVHDCQDELVPGIHELASLSASRHIRSRACWVMGQFERLSAPAFEKAKASLEHVAKNERVQLVQNEACEALKSLLFLRENPLEKYAFLFSAERKVSPQGMLRYLGAA